MSIATEIQNYNNGLLAAYNAVSKKGGNVPAQKNLNNLFAAIGSIPDGHDPYITFSTESGTNSLILTQQYSGGLNLEYSYNTTTWTTWDLTTPLTFGGATKLYLRGTNQTLASGASNYTLFRFTDETTLVDCSGRITRLLDYNGMSDYELNKTYCFYNLFFGCKALRTPPELSPLRLTNNCYNNMFYNCPSLTTAPELPATTIANYCYYNMFYGCSSLTTAPELPATTLALNCYNAMFYNCNHLTTAPDLLVATLTTGCYNQMFYGCSRLNYVKCLATNQTISNCNSWLSGVSSTGTFVKATGATWRSGTHGIPTNWTVEEV